MMDRRVPNEILGDVIVMPREIGPSGEGLYDDSVITIVKDFRAVGVSADFEHQPDARGWIGEQAAAIYVIDLIIGIASHAGWNALCWIVGKQHKSDQVRVRVARCHQTATETTWEWHELEGSGEAVAKALAAIEAADDEGLEVEQETAPKAIEDHPSSAD
jgi:hypothetical protein